MRRSAIIAGRVFIGGVWLTFGGVVLLVAFLCWHRWDGRTNHGWTFGYYGEMNRVERALKDIPGVRVISHYANRDLFLEEFGFGIQSAAHGERMLNVSESDPLRQLAGAELAVEVRRRLGASKTSGTDRRHSK
ncbi:MAG: hypothetical protein K1X78_04785 [Verrucomicrobiaceae bacterium]|nr:hypothetical protein [Verrucomicrobiaceae bacterium]